MKQVMRGKSLVNVMTADDYGVGAGFPVGVLTLKDVYDNQWYTVQVSGSVPTVSTHVNPSPLTYYGTSSFYDTNYPYQLVAGDDENTYQVYLSASTVVVNPTMWASGSFIKSMEGAIVPTCKPNLLFQNITDGNFYGAYLYTSASVMALGINQTIISQSSIKSIY